MGPLRRATGPPQSGAGVEERLKTSKIQKNDCPKIQRFHRPPSIIQKMSRSFQNHLVLVGFIYVLRLQTILYDLLRFRHRCRPYLLNTLGDTNCFGPTRI